MNGVKVEADDISCVSGQYDDSHENLVDNSIVNYSPTSEERPYSLPAALGEHFTVQREAGDGTISGMCHSCGATLKFTLRATSNLITHLKRCDPSRYEMYCQNRKCKRARRRSPVGFGSMLKRSSVGFESGITERHIGTESVIQNCTWKQGQTHGVTNSEAALTDCLDLRCRSNSDESSACKPIMKHFKMRQLTAQGNITARCLSCGVDVKASVRASSNLITHLKRCCPIRFERYCQDRVKSNRCWQPSYPNSCISISTTEARNNPLPHITRTSVTSKTVLDNTSAHKTPTSFPSSAVNSASPLDRPSSLSFTAANSTSPNTTSTSLTTSTVPFNNISTRSLPDEPRRHSYSSQNTPHAINSVSKRASPGTHSADRTSCHQMFGAPQSKQRKMVKSLILSAASDHVPYDTILKPNIKKFLSQADNSFILPDLDTMNDVIVPLCAQKIQEKIISELQHVDLLYLNVTVWTNQNSVTHASFQVNFVNDDWCVIERHLGNYATVTKFRPSWLVSAIDDVTERFKINSKVTKILLDNKTPFADDLMNFSYVTSPCSYNNLSDSEFSALLSFLPETIGSVTQRLRFVVVQSLWGNDTSLMPVRVALKKAVNLIVAMSNSRLCVEYLSEQSVDMIAARETNKTNRWLSTLEAAVLISRNVTQFNVALDFLEAPYNSSLALTASELEILKEITEIFNPFVTMMKCLTEDKLRAMCPLVKGLMKSLDSANFVQLRHCATIRSRAFDSAIKWLGSFLTYDDVAIASFLDPRFKLGWLETQDEKDALLAKVKNYIAKLNVSTKNSILAQSSLTENCDVTNAACQYYLSEPISSVDTDPLLYWKCCPTTLLPLALLARAILVCTKNFCTGETLDNISAWEKCYQVFSDDELRRNLSIIDRNKDLFQNSL